MEQGRTKSVNRKLEVYEPPLVDVFEIAIENGFASSGGETEKWDETPGGGNF